MTNFNERKTEQLVEKRLRKFGYNDRASDITIERQKSDTPRIQKLLETASKRGNGVGRPEYIIHSPKFPGFIVVIECKADPRKHASPQLDKYADFALDGALLYASYLSKDFDVLAIAVSGQDETTFRVSHHLHLKGAAKSIVFDVSEEFVSLEEYHSAFENSETKFRQDYDALLEFSRTLNNTLQAKKITESERAFLISGILIGLQSPAFRASYTSHRSGKQLATSLISTIRGEFESARLPEDRRENLELAFSFISKSPALTGDKEFFNKTDF